MTSFMILNQELERLNDEQAVEIFKALSNQTRIKILQTLKDPDNNFSTQAHIVKVKDLKVVFV